MDIKAAICVLVVMISIFGFSSCKVVKEGVTGEREEQDEIADEMIPSLPAAFPIFGDWYGVYNGSESLSLFFDSELKCEMQTAVYKSKVLGPRYYGDYRWGGDDGKEVILDLYKGVSEEVEDEAGNKEHKWIDGGREKATTALNISFRIYGGSVKPIAIKSTSKGYDTEGYMVVPTNVFVMLVPGQGDSQGTVDFLFGSAPRDTEEGKTASPVTPDVHRDKAERFYTTAEELNVRCGPSTDYGSYGQVPLGTPVECIGSMTGVSDWVFVLFAGGGGWCNTTYLSESPPSQT